MIFHVAVSVEWELQDSYSTYVPKAYEKDGFVHCCTNEQLAGVLERYYKDQIGLIVIQLDESQLENPLIYEKATNHELFPHVYGGINKTAIVSIEKIR